MVSFSESGMRRRVAHILTAAAKFASSDVTIADTYVRLSPSLTEKCGLRDWEYTASLVGLKP